VNAAEEREAQFRSHAESIGQTGQEGKPIDDLLTIACYDGRNKSEKETTPVSAETVITIIRRAAAEVEFRAALFADPAAALADYDLSAAERAALTGLTAESFDALAGELEARRSKSAFGGEIPDPGARGQSL